MGSVRDNHTSERPQDDHRRIKETQVVVVVRLSLSLHAVTSPVQMLEWYRATEPKPTKRSRRKGEPSRNVTIRRHVKAEDLPQLWFHPHRQDPLRDAGFHTRA